jgi:hypothetical protein
VATTRSPGASRSRATTTWSSTATTPAIGVSTISTATPATWPTARCSRPCASPPPARAGGQLGTAAGCSAQAPVFDVRLRPVRPGPRSAAAIHRVPPRAAARHAHHAADAGPARGPGGRARAGLYAEFSSRPPNARPWRACCGAMPGCA